MNATVDTTLVVLDYLAAATRLDQEAERLREQGFTHWADEVEAFAVIADRAADGEADNPRPGDRPCRLCGGKRFCDLALHGVGR